MGRILTEDVTAPSPLPPWDNSAMDGYAVRATDLQALQTLEQDCCEPGSTSDPEGTVLEVVETIRAGQVGTRVVEPGTCARIMTGAPVPDGADAIVMQEYTEAISHTPHRVRFSTGAKQGQHIRRCGEEVATGDVVLRLGEQLGPACIGLCAAVGRTHVQVARQMRVAIVSTGDEIVAPGQALGPGQIHSSNTHALTGWVHRAGGIAIDCGIAPDTIEGTREAFRRALDADIIVSTGGVSVGDFDVVRQALTDEGAQMHFWKVRMKPGKPLAFGTIGGRPAFGLPGNPVSCQVGFLQFVRPYIRMAMGDPAPYLPVVDAHWNATINKRPGRPEFIRVVLTWSNGRLQATKTGSQSSGQQTSMVQAQGLAMLPTDSSGAKPGDPVAVQLLTDAFGGSTSPDYPW